MDDPFSAAVAAHKAGDYEAAIRGYRSVLHLRNARHNLGALFNQLGRLDEAEAALSPVVEQFPDFAPSRFSLATALLAQQRYAEAWPLYEAQRHVDNPAIFEPQTEAPEWRGEPIAGRRLLVCAPPHPGIPTSASCVKPPPADGDPCCTRSSAPWPRAERPSQFPRPMALRSPPDGWPSGLRQRS